MANSINWGQGAVNNDVNWGKARFVSSIIDLTLMVGVVSYEKSYRGETNIVGVGQGVAARERSLLRLYFRARGWKLFKR